MRDIKFFNYWYFLLNLLIPKYFHTLVYKKNQLNQLLIYVNDKEKGIYNLYFLLIFLKKNILFKFNLLLDICVVDYPNKIKRFELNYIILSLKNNFKFLIKNFTKELDFNISLNYLFKNSIWLEREVWDLFGIFFYGNYDLRRILTDYGFEGFPLRKDFPLSGYIELRYNEENKSIVYEPLELTQKFRYFSFISPWEKIIY